MSATAGYDAPEKPGKILLLPVPTGGVNYFAGNLMAVNGAGNAVLAADTAGLRVVGRLERDVANGLNWLGHPEAEVKRGAFGYTNSAAHPLAAGDIGTVCFVEDSETVAKSSTNSIKAGIFLGFDTAGLAIVDTSSAITG